MPQVMIENTPLISKMVCLGLSEDEVVLLRDKVRDECVTAFDIAAAQSSVRRVMTRKNWLTRETLNQVTGTIADFAKPFGSKVCVIVSSGQAIVYW